MKKILIFFSMVLLLFGIMGPAYASTADYFFDFTNDSSTSLADYMQNKMGRVVDTNDFIWENDSIQTKDFFSFLDFDPLRSDTNGNFKLLSVSFSAIVSAAYDRGDDFALDVYDDASSAYHTIWTLDSGAGTFSSPNIVFDNDWEVTKLKFRGRPDSVGIDNLTVTAPVPEPAGISLFLGTVLGTGLAGPVVLRKKKLVKK